MQLTGPPVTAELTRCVGGLKTALLGYETTQMSLRPLQNQQKIFERDLGLRDENPVPDRHFRCFTETYVQLIQK